MSYFLLSQAQAQVLHHEGNLTHVIFPSLINKRTRTRPFPMHHEGNLMHDIFPYLKSTRASPKTTLQHEENITHANYLSILKRSTKTSQLPTTTLHRVGSTNALPKTTTFHHEKS